MATQREFDDWLTAMVAAEDLESMKAKCAEYSSVIDKPDTSVDELDVAKRRIRIIRDRIEVIEAGDINL